MDRGRIIDQISNNNARFLLDFEDKKTSKNIVQPPGGKSTFSLAWGMPEQENPKKQLNNIPHNNIENQNNFNNNRNNNINRNFSPNNNNNFNQNKYTPNNNNNFNQNNYK